MQKYFSLLDLLFVGFGFTNGFELNTRSKGGTIQELSDVNNKFLQP
jgi:hypothetical protein